MTEPKQLVEYTDTAPKGWWRKLLFPGVNVALRVVGIKLPPYFTLKDRVYILGERVFFLEGRSEPDIQNLCRRLMGEGMTVIDIGANVGFLTRQFCRRVGRGGKVFAFEPDPFTFAFLEFNTRAFPNKQLTLSAVSDNHEPALLHLNPHHGAGNSLFNKADATESVSIPCISLDEFLDKAGNPIVDIIKIDVEGAELSVLRGMRGTIARLPKMQMIIEYCPKNLRGSGVDPRAVYDEIKAGGFNIQRILEDGSTQSMDKFESLEPVLNHQGYTNLLCTRNKP
jgi:FkbM family methyltransferase